MILLLYHTFIISLLTILCTHHVLVKISTTTSSINSNSAIPLPYFFVVKFVLVVQQIHLNISIFASLVLQKAHFVCVKHHNHYNSQRFAYNIEGCVPIICLMLMQEQCPVFLFICIICWA